MRKILTILLSVALIITSISVGLIASAEDVNANVDEILELSTSETPTLSSENRLTGTPKYCSSTATTFTERPTCDSNTETSTFIYDGVLNANDPTSSSRSGSRFYNGLLREGNSTNSNTAISGESKAKFVLNMGKVYAIDSFLVAGSTNHHPITSFEIYVGDDMDTLFSEDNKIAIHTRTDSTKYMYHIKLKEAVSFNYYGIKILAVDKDTSNVSTHSTDASIYLNELGAYGTVNTTFETPTALPTDESLISGEHATQRINYAGNEETDTTKNNIGTPVSISCFTNGTLETSSLSNTRLIKANRKYGTTTCITGMKMAYDLGNVYDISGALLATGNGDGANNPAQSEWRLYVSNSLDTLYNPENLTAHVVDTRDGLATKLIQVVDPNAKGRYVGFEFMKNTDSSKEQVWLDEIAIYGTPDWFVETAQTTKQFYGENVLNGLTQLYFKGATGTSFGVKTAGSNSNAPVSKLFDNSTSTGNVLFYNLYKDGATTNQNSYLKMSLDNAVTIAAVSLGANANMSGVSSYTVSWEAYVSNDDDDSTLFNEENLFAICENEAGHAVTTVIAKEYAYKEGKHFGIKITGHTAPVSSSSMPGCYYTEIGFYSPNTAEITNPTTAPHDNLLAGRDLYLQKQNETSANVVAGLPTISDNNAAVLTDGNFFNNTGAAYGTGLRVYNGYNAKLSYELAQETDISKILVATGVPSTGSNDSGVAYADTHQSIPYYGVFVADDASTLFNIENMVASYYNFDGSTVQCFEPKNSVRGKYFGIWVFDAKAASGVSILFTELAVYGNYVTDGYTIENEPAEDELSLNELQFATLSEGTDTGNVLSDGVLYYTGDNADDVLTFEDAGTKTFTYDLGGTVSINSLLVASKYDLHTNLTPSNYKIYIADSLEALDTAEAIVDYYPSNYVAESGTYEGSVHKFDLATAKQGSFVRFVIKSALSNDDLNLTELGVYSNALLDVALSGDIKAPAQVYVDGVTTDFTTETDSIKLPSVIGRDKHSVVVADAEGNTEVYFVDRGTPAIQTALNNAFSNKSAELTDSTAYGIEFKVDITDNAMAKADEIGIVVAKSQTLNGADLIADDNAGYKFAKAVAFDGTENYMDGNSFSATLHNFEPYKYLYRYAARAYIIVDGYVVYGTTFETTPAAAAQRVVDNSSIYSEELVNYAQNIVDNSKLSDSTLARAEFLELASATNEALDAKAVLANSVAVNGDSVNLARLKAVVEKAKAGEDIVIATLGGSITQGFNADYNPATSEKDLDRGTHCWSNLLREWLENTFGVNVTLVNAGIGSTTSTIGVGRIVNDVLSHNPDLVVMEYAVNDNDSDKVAYEACVRRVLSYTSDETDTADTALMLLFTIRRDLKTNSETGEQEYVYSNKQANYIPIAEHYGVPMVSYMDAILPLIEDGTYTWRSFSNDEIHPHAYGHQVIAALMGDYLADVIEAVDAGSVDDTLTQVPSEIVYEGADILQTATLYHSDTLPAEWVESYGSFEVSHNIHSQFPNGWLADYANGNEPMVIKIPAARKLYFLVHNKGTSALVPTFADASLDFTTSAGTTTQKLVTNASGDYANAILRYESDTSGEVTVTITPQTTVDLQQFKLLGIIVAE